MKRLGPDQFADFLCQPTPWIDLRSPVEFAEGSIPGAVNLPLLSDAERHQIGLTYKTQGQASAVELGHKLVSGAVRAERLKLWQDAIARHPDAILFCFRGGLRSQIVQQWLAELGLARPIVTGGYKALRRFLLESFERIVPATPFLVVSGPTGSGKTAYLHQSGKPFVDLEALAFHRGSAFGAFPKPQPTQVDFENALAQKFLQLEPVQEQILIESESRLIGRCYVPAVLHQKIRTSPRLILQTPLEERVDNIWRDYILQTKLGLQGDVSRFDELRNSVKAIARKLGGARTQEILADLDQAQHDFQNGLGLDSNRSWIRKLLVWYYDPLYEYSASQG